MPIASLLPLVAEAPTSPRLPPAVTGAVVLGLSLLVTAAWVLYLYR